MSQFTVYSAPGSPYGRAVLSTLIEKGAKFRFVAVSIAETKAEPYLSRHPFGRVPAIENGGFALYETQAILRYLDRTFSGPPLTPAKVTEAARMDQIMGINDWYLFQGVNNVIGFQRIIRPKLMGLPPDEAAIAAAMPQAEKVFAELSRLLGDKTYLAASNVSLADMMVAPHLDFLAETPEWAPLTAGRQNLCAYLARMKARPSFEATTWERVARMAATV